MQEKPDFVKNTEEVYKSISRKIHLIRHVDKIKVGPPSIDNIIKPAYLKCYDFMMFLCSFQNVEHSFYYLPNLRGLCEDLISITFLLKMNDTDKLSTIISQQIRNQKKTLETQNSFLRIHNPGQILIPENILPELKELLKLYNKKEGVLSEKHLPSVQKTSKQVGLESLYNFLYHATSKTVHFDIDTLISTGWGTLDKEKKHFENSAFSFKNNYRQYYRFALFYTSLIFIYQTQAFSNTIDTDHYIIEKLNKLQEGYKIIDWPTPISFRQLNIKEPTTVQKFINRVFLEGDHTTPD